MTVGELIEILKIYDKEKDILIEGKSELHDISGLCSTRNLGTDEEYIAIQPEG
ncbi:hypothetical protein ACQQ97_07035 [Anaerovoracaceae bacterium SGI.195]